MSAPCAAPRTWRSTGLGERDVVEVALADAVGRRDVARLAGAGERRVRLQAEPRVGAQRARVGRGQDDAPAGVVGVVVAGVRAPRCRRRSTGARGAVTSSERPHTPSRLSARPADDQAAVALGAPGALGVGADEVARADVGDRGVRPRVHRQAVGARVVLERRRTSARRARGRRPRSAGGSQVGPARQVGMERADVAADEQRAAVGAQVQAGREAGLDRPLLAAGDPADGRSSVVRRASTALSRSRAASSSVAASRRVSLSSTIA